MISSVSGSKWLTRFFPQKSLIYLAKEPNVSAKKPYKNSKKDNDGGKKAAEWSFRAEKALYVSALYTVTTPNCFVFETFFIQGTKQTIIRERV